jgi:hypothetical protein
MMGPDRTTSTALVIRNIRRQRFTKEEDRRLNDLVGKHGTSAWAKVAQDMGGVRTPRQLRERWYGYLKPELNPEYTPEQDRLLLDLYNEFGSKWAKIAAALGNKSQESVRNHYSQLKKRTTNQEQAGTIIHEWVLNTDGDDSIDQGYDLSE